jgi:hypothetical protein
LPPHVWPPPALDPLTPLLSLGPLGTPLYGLLTYALYPYHLILLSIQQAQAEEALRQGIGQAVGPVVVPGMALAVLIVLIAAVVVIAVLLLIFIAVMQVATRPRIVNDVG